MPCRLCDRPLWFFEKQRAICLQCHDDGQIRLGELLALTWSWARMIQFKGIELPRVTIETEMPRIH